MKKFILIFIITLVASFVLGVVVTVNVPGITSIFKGSTVYTSKAVENARKDGYEEGLKDKKNLQLQVESLKNNMDKFQNLYNEEVLKSAEYLKQLRDSQNQSKLDKQQIADLNAQLNESQQKISKYEELVRSLQEQLDYYIGILEEFQQSKYFKVTYTVEDKTFGLAYVENGGHSNFDLEPSKDYYTFLGWSYDGINVVNHKAETITGDVEFKAVFKANSGLFGEDGEVIKAWDELLNEGYFVVRADEKNEGKYILDTNNENESASAFVELMNGTVKIDSSISEISGQAFIGCVNIKEVVLPNGLKKIGYGCFMNCSSLKNPTIPETVQQIDVQAFANCTNITEIIIPDGVKELENGHIFQGCSNLVKVTLGKSITSIGSACFENCSPSLSVYYQGDIDAWVQIKFGSMVLSSVDSLFINETLLTTANITKSNIVNSYAFYGYKKLTNVILGDSVNTIGEYAFSLSSINSVELGKNIKNIGQFAFNYDEIESCNYTGTVDDWAQINFENSEANPLRYAKVFKINGAEINDLLFTCENISAYAFTNCKNIKSINIPNVKNIGIDAFENCISLDTIHWGNFLTRIENGAFYNTGLTGKLEISEGVTSIGTDAFASTKITSVVLPESIEYIGRCPFDVNNLNSVTFKKVRKWYLKSNYIVGQVGTSYKTLLSSELENPQKNAEYFTSTYAQYEWQISSWQISG